MQWIKATERIWEYGVPVIVRCLGEVSIERYHNIIEVMPVNLIEWLDESDKKINNLKTITMSELKTNGLIQPNLCEHCGLNFPDHDVKCIKSPETKAQLLINEHLKFNDNKNAAISHSLITVNMVKAVLPNGDLMAYYSRVRQVLINNIKYD